MMPLLVASLVVVAAIEATCLVVGYRTRDAAALIPATMAAVLLAGMVLLIMAASQPI